jgi:hypothetical protein
MANPYSVCLNLLGLDKQAPNSDQTSFPRLLLKMGEAVGIDTSGNDADEVLKHLASIEGEESLAVTRMRQELEPLAAQLARSGKPRL